VALLHQQQKHGTGSSLPCSSFGTESCNVWLHIVLAETLFERNTSAAESVHGTNVNCSYL
jgi:hypothetical protein